MSFILARISSSVIARKFFIFVISLVVTLAVFLSSKSSWASWPEYPNERIASLILFNPQTQEDYGDVRGIALAPDDTHAYLACGNDFVVVNLLGPSVETVLDWALGVGVAITPNGQYVYLAQGNGYVKVLPTSNYSNSYFKLVSSYPLQNIDITPDGHYAYITSYDMNNHTGYLHVLDVWNYSQQVKNLTFQGRWLKDIDFSPDGRYAYVVDYSNNQVLAISTSDYTLVRTYNDTNEPWGAEQIAVTPDGKHAYLTHLSGNYVSDINLETGTISTIPVAGPRGVAITPDGKFVYITHGSPSSPVQVIHTQDNSVDSINAYCAGKAIAINSNGTRVYGGNWDAWHSSFIVIGYGKGYKLIPIPSDPSPVSNVMAGGNVIRYYRVTDYDNTPKSGIPAKVEGNNLSWTFTSANDGLLTISIPVDSLGNPGDDVVCTITELNNEPVDPPTFGVHIVPREVASHYRFGSGASIGAAIGLGAKVGSKHGLNYTRKETDLTVDTDDVIDVEDFSEISGGVYAGCGVGGGIKGAAYAKAEAEAGIDILASIANQYEFTSPYTGREKMCRAGLILAKVFLGVAPPLVSDMVTWLADNYNSYFTEYKSGQTISMGARVYGEAGAGTGLGVAGDDEVYLGIGIGAGISGDAQVMVELISSYQYYGGSLDLTEIGAGVGFNCGVDVSAGITATAVGNAVRAGIGGDVSYQQELVLYANPGGELQRMEITFSSQKNWGIGIDGTIAPGSGTTDTVILTINKDQITSLASDIVDIALLSSYFNGISPEDIVLGPTRLRDEFRDLFNKLSTMNIPYRIEREKGCGFEFSPSISLALGVEVETGVSFNVEKAVTYTREEGYIVGTDFDSKIPTAVYNDDSHVPSLNDLEYSDVIGDVAQTVYDAFSSAGKIVQGAAESVGDTMVYGYHWAKKKLTGKKLGETEEQKLTYSLRYYLEQQQNYQGTNEVFLFSSSVQDISDLSAKISSSVTITNGHANLTINPGQNEAQLTITYTDQQVSGLQEDQLCIHIWNQDTHKWQALASVVNTDLNQVTAPVSRLGTFSLFITFPTGDIELGINPELINLQNPQNIT
ncbi:YncE family protein, partial [Candidatus Aerophobetes bacterium]|nr:YncE family protein [Candidatus Aerophobetes bacterium]